MFDKPTISKRLRKRYYLKKHNKYDISKEKNRKKKYEKYKGL